MAIEVGGNEHSIAAVRQPSSGLASTPVRAPPFISKGHELPEGPQEAFGELLSF